MGGGEGTSSPRLSQEEESLEDHHFQIPPELSSDDEDTQRDDFDVNEEGGLKFDEFDDLGLPFSPASFDYETHWRSNHRLNEEIMQSYDSLQMRIGSLNEAKSKILSYKPGAWIEEVGGMKMSDYDIPKTTTLILIGPRGSGKSSLVNKISRVFEDDKFTSVRAQVSRSSSIGGGTYFLQEYMIPRGSNSFCMYDTRGLSESSCDNFAMIKSWMTKGVRHGEVVIRDSDSSSVRNCTKCKAQQRGYYSTKMRMINFVIFVVNGLSVLKSMDGEDNMEYARLLAKTFSFPHLSFKDDKPVVVMTHGDLLSRSDRARARIHLGELLGVPPAKQIFDIPEKCDPATELTVVDMLRYSLEHADRNLPHKHWSLYKVLGVLIMISLACVCLFAIWGNTHSLEKRMDWHVIWHSWCSSKNHINGHAIWPWWTRSEEQIDWHKIRHLW